MIKKILSAALIFSSIFVSAQSFTATYDFSATTTGSGTTDPTPTPTVTGLTCGSFKAIGTPSANPNAGGRFSFVGWPTGALTGTTSVDTYSTMTGSINTSEYYEVVLTPQSGYTLDLNNIAFTAQRSGAGIRNYAVRTSADGFANNLLASVLTGTNLSVVGTNEFFWNFDAITSAQNGSNINLLGASTTSSVSFRFYGWNSETLSGTFSIDNVVFTGTVTGIAAPCNSPTITTITSNGAICSNQVLNLASTVLGDAPFTYTWTGAGAFGSANSASTTVTGATSSDYILTVSNACGTETAAITATVNSIPSVLITGTQTLNCNTPNVSITVTTTPSSGLTYTWTGTVVSGQGTNQVIVDQANNYSVTVMELATGCGNSASSTVLSNTVLPVVTLNLSSINMQCVTVNSVTLTGGSPAGGVYSGIGVNSGVFSPSSVGTGTYSILYTFTNSVNGCSNSASDDIMVNTCTGIVILNSESFTIYPNPNNGHFLIKSPVFPAKVNVFDLSGKHIISQNISSMETMIDLSKVVNGVYQLNIITDGNSFNHKIMINK